MLYISCDPFIVFLSSQNEEVSQMPVLMILYGYWNNNEAMKFSEEIFFINDNYFDEDFKFVPTILNFSE